MYDDDEDLDSVGVPPFTGARILVTLTVVAIFVLALPDSAASQHEALWDARERLRGSLFHILELTLQGPIFKFFACGVRKVTGGLFSSRCRPPSALIAKAIGQGAVLVRWRARAPALNPFHEERYVCAWRRIADGRGASTVAGGGDPCGAAGGGGACEGDVEWQLRVVTENLCRRDAFMDTLGWGVILEGLPDAGILRLRVRAENRWGRSAWATEELEVDMSRRQGDASEGVVTNGPFHRDCGIGSGRSSFPGRSRSSALASRGAGAGGRPCLRCRAPQATSGASCVGLYADVVSRPLFGKECPHGPFCPRCRHRVSVQTLPSCVCRALVGTWRDGEARPSPSAAGAGGGSRDVSASDSAGGGGDGATTHDAAAPAGGAKAAAATTAVPGVAKGGDATEVEAHASEVRDSATASPAAAAATS